MKILRIAGRNLASLAGEFAVDFESEPLASAGLFAISGPTGAGKSTLLDALCLALYGTTPRLPKSARGGSALPDAGGEAVSTFDPRNLLRRGAAEAFAEVDFVGNDDQRYRARWSVRRSRNKASGLLQASHMTLHRLPDLLALGGTKSEAALEIAQRIGLSFEQFTRSVLLAQNEFSAFLKTDENERGELLETLTGSTVYSEISRRAFERYKNEQEAMRHLSRKLADQAPLPPDERVAIDAELASAAGVLDALDAQKAQLEQQLRWHQDLARLRAGETAAQAAISDAAAQVEQAAPRRRRLATLDAVQEARPLTAELARLAVAHTQAQGAVQDADTALMHALAAQRQATLDAGAAQMALAGAESAQRDALPMLDDAKRLDATIAALAPAHAHARSTRDAARAQAAGAQTALTAGGQLVAVTQAAQQTGADWLARHADAEALAAQWPRWDRLFEQAENAGARVADGASALSAAQEAAGQAAATEQQHAASLAAAHDNLTGHDTRRQQAAATLAAFDADALRASRHALDARRERLAVAQHTWAALADTRQRHGEVQAQASHLEQSAAAAQAALDAATQAAVQLSASAVQSERLLGNAELACARDVIDLRANLADDTPCPVCGSASHPYQHQDSRLEAVLDGLRDEVRRSRAEVQANLSTQATQRAAVESIAERLPPLQRERAQLGTSLAELDAEWAAEAIASEAPEESARASWFGEQLATLRDVLRTIDQQELAARRAGAARDAAQQAFEQAGKAHAALLQAAGANRTALARLDAECAALAATQKTALAALAGLLEELDAVLPTGWQARWAAGPAAYRAARNAEAGAWSERAAAHAAGAATLARQQADQAMLAHAARQHAASAALADTVFAERDAELRVRQSERAMLWNGRPASTVEQELAGAVAMARDAVGACQALVQAAAQNETVARAARAQAGAQVTSVQASAASITQRLAEWLEEYAGVQAERDPVHDAAELGRLLAVGGAWMAQERAALAAVEVNLQRAATVHAERQAQTVQHLATQAGAPPADTVETALADLLERRRTAHDAAAALRLRCAQDDARRRDAQAVIAEIERQQATEQRWGRLSELIGSADGKKFRNYAQQFTLDVLLGYANRHLGQLARRYRLERVMHSAGPSLALMVRDQDMGGETRSVNSLSGGESFLVSLALALGLASLSSNRVRVESLFIDEGFGSLDSDTLGVAMDALDALQSMGRKVGVISHVQEMTERIAAKILVRPAGGGSSAVTVSV